MGVCSSGAFPLEDKLAAANLQYRMAKIELIGVFLVKLEMVCLYNGVVGCEETMKTESGHSDGLRIGFGGGCHWCTEAVFMSLRGVSNVAQGYIQSASPNDAFSEAVVVQFDDAVIALQILIEVHLRTHSSTSKHKMRGKYRSAIYTFDAGQLHECERLLATSQTEFDQSLVTQVLPCDEFKPSDERYHNYYYSNTDKAFCKTYIDPKLALLRKRYQNYLTTPANVDKGSL